MNVGLTIDICACILFVVMIISHFRNNLWTVPDKIFFLMLLAGIISAVTDILSLIFNGCESASFVFLQLNSDLYFLARNLTAYIYICYIISVTVGWKVFCSRKQYLITLSAPIIVSVLIILSNPWTHLVFLYDAAKVYHRCPTMVILYIIAGLYLIYSLYLVQRYHAMLTPQKRLALRAFFPISVLSVLIQAAFPEFTIEMFATAICMLLVMFTIQRPEEIIDGVTGLWNRSAFMQDINLHFQSGTEFTIINIDISNLKILNETIGWVAVSEILSSISLHLKKHHRECDGLYNTANGIFNIIFLKKQIDNSDAIAEQLNDRFKQAWLYHDLELQLQAHVTVLHCPLDLVDKDDVMMFIHDIDKRSANDDRVLHAKDYDRSRARRKKEIEKIINTALTEKKFEVYYQPIYSVRDQAFTSAEALIRLNDEQYGFIPPDEFIPIAEENMSILKIGTYVLETVCEFIAAGGLREKGIHYIEVNLSVVQCMQTDMAQQIIEIVKRYDIEPGLINLEITETATLYSPETMKRNMKTLKEYGILFSLDDYGSGYATLNYLLNFPFSLIKLDRGIVCAENSGQQKWIALKYTMEMLLEMGYDIVAEGVETLDMVQDLSKQRCHYLQGYYFSKAIPSDDFIRFLDTQKNMEPLKV